MKKVKMLARPKTGRKTFTRSVSLTDEQNKWLDQFPNASELLRKLIDDMMAIHGEVEPALSLLALKHEIDFFESKLVNLEYGEKSNWVRDLYDWKTNKKGWDAMYDKDPDDTLNLWPTKYPVQTPEAAYYSQQLKIYDAAIEGIKA